jgi:isoprenylcysteine carboxyl methyltransferase (ICMT) family protein YpbQ
MAVLLRALGIPMQLDHCQAAGENGPPRSCSGYSIGALGLMGFVAGLWAASAGMLPAAVRVLALVSITAVPMIVWALWVERVNLRKSAGLMSGPVRPRDIGRVYTKLVGLAGTAGFMTAAYWLFPIYRDPLYHTFFELVWILLPSIAALSLLYVYWIDPRLSEPKDATWHFGCLLLGRWSEADLSKVREHVLGWTIKGFFLPIMVGWLGQNLDWLARPGLFAGVHDFLAAADVAKTAIFTLDLGFATVGYVLTLRIIDGQIRSPEPTMLGWSVALICYPPINDLVFKDYLTWSNDYQWQTWLSAQPTLLVIWGSIIVLIELLFALATVSFGYRFSNLTHRGIVTHGLYRLTKHPAYITKCLSFWMIAIPFIPAQGWDEAARQSLALTGISLIYWLRARTEERHLSRDPVYVEYALWIERNGMFRWLGQAIPILHYRPPVHTDMIVRAGAPEWMMSA